MRGDISPPDRSTGAQAAGDCPNTIRAARTARRRSCRIVSTRRSPGRQSGCRISMRGSQGPSGGSPAIEPEATDTDGRSTEPYDQRHAGPALLSALSSPPGSPGSSRESRILRTERNPPHLIVTGPGSMIKRISMSPRGAGYGGAEPGMSPPGSSDGGLPSPPSPASWDPPTWAMEHTAGGNPWRV